MYDSLKGSSRFTQSEIDSDRLRVGRYGPENDHFLLIEIYDMPIKHGQLSNLTGRTETGALFHLGGPAGGGRSPVRGLPH